MKTEREIKNKERAKYCIGCAWLHIGEDVDHNHCDYTSVDELHNRVNGLFDYTSHDGGKTYKLIFPYSQCKWFWDEKKNSSPSKEGTFYKAPKSNACPKIPKIKTEKEL